MKRGAVNVVLPEGVHTVRTKGRTYYYWHPGRGSANAPPARRIPGDPTDPAFWQFLQGKKQVTWKPRT